MPLFCDARLGCRLRTATVAADAFKHCCVKAVCEWISSFSGWVMQGIRVGHGDELVG